MPIRDDDMSFLDWLSSSGAAAGRGAYNALSQLTPIGTSPEGNMSLKVPNALTALAKASDPYQPDDLSFRGVIAPLGTKTRGTYPGGASQEELTLAWPEMIASPIESYRRLMDPERSYG